HAYPLAVARKQPAPPGLAGWNPPEAARRIVVEPAEQDEYLHVRHPEVAGVGTVRVEPHPVIAEIEPNGCDKPQTVEVPVTIDGRIDNSKDVDVFRFAARKGERLLLQVESAALGFPLDPSLRLTDDAGKLITEVDDTGRGSLDPETTFTAPADGFY